MKKGRLCEMLEDVFNFVDVRICKIAKDLAHLSEQHKFMDSDAETAKNRKQSTAVRWQAQADLIPACKLIKKVGEYFVIEQAVKAAGQTTQDVTILHIVTLKEFAWSDSAENNPPTCCCPANRNAKDVCCGIMFAVTQVKDKYTQYLCEDATSYPCA
jgi:hypothetical protein